MTDPRASCRTYGELSFGWAYWRRHDAHIRRQKAAEVAGYCCGFLLLTALAYVSLVTLFCL